MIRVDFSANFRRNWDGGGRTGAQGLHQGSLPPLERERVLAGLAFRDPALRAELRALAAEADPELFYEGLLGMGARLERAGDLNSAIPIYAAIVGAVPPLTGDKREGPLQRSAQARLDAILGRGAFGPRAEFLFRHFAREASRPDMILGMTAAGLVASGLRFGVLSRLAASPTATWFNRGAGAALTASAAAFLPETAAFWSAARLWNLAAGERLDWTAAGIGREWASLALTLGFLKLGGALSHGIFHRVHGIDPLAGGAGRLPGFTRVSRPLFEQIGVFSGIHLGHWAEARLGLRPQDPHANPWLESLATLLHLHVGGRLAHHAWGPTQARRMRALALQTRQVEAWGALAARPEAWGEFRRPSVYAMAMGDAGGAGPRGPGEIWGEWIGARERPAPKYYRTPVYEYGDAAEFLEGVRRASRGLGPEVRCLFVQVESQNGYGEAAVLRELLRVHPGLQEIRLRFLGGRLVWLVKEEGGRIISESEEADPNDPVHLGHDLPLEAVFKVRLRPRWSSRRPTGPLHEMLGEARVQAGLDLPDVARRLLEEPNLRRELSFYRGAFRGISDLRAWEAGPKRAIPFPLLRALAEMYGQDLRTWIAASNRDLHPDIPRRLWEGEYYPLYLEAKTDLDRLREYDAAPEGRGRGSFGWRLFEARKNPDRYFSTGALAERVGILPKMLHDFERNHHSPNAATLRALVEALNRTEADLAGAVSRTFHPDLPLAELFPGQEIFLTPHSLDAAKVAAYAREPGSLGQYLFAARKLRPGFPSADEVSAEIGRNPNYFARHESNAVHFGRDNLHEWLWLWDRMGLPRELFLGIAERRHGIPRGDPAYLLAEALEGRSLEQVQAESEISTKTLSAILQQRDNLVTPASLLSLKEALPRLEAARLYQRYYPELPYFFPELSAAGEPHLRVDPQALPQLFRRFHLGEALFAHRMNADPPLSTVQLAEALRWDNPTVGRHERQFSRIEDDASLRRLAEVLGLSPGELYLYFRPEVLRLFPLRDPAGEPWTLSEEAYRALISSNHGGYDRHNLRRRLSPEILRLPPRHDADGNLDPVVTLARAYGLEASQAQKLLDPARPLGDADLRWLAERFPRLSYREWYEHFHRPELAFFLGRREDGAIDYRLPEGLDFAALERLDTVARIEERSRETGGAVPLSVLRSLRKSGNPGERSLVQISRWTGLDRRLLFLYFRREDLRPFLENRGSASSEGR